MKQVDVLIFTTGQGHDTLSKVMAEAIEDKTNYSTKIFKYDPEVFIHKFLHRYFPRLMRLLAKPIGTKFGVKLSRYLTGLKFHSVVEEQISKRKPKVVISTFFVLNPVIEKLKDKYDFYFINLMTDPKTMILLNPSPWADVNYTFDDYQSAEISKQYPGSKNKEVGWFVKSVFEEKYDQRKIKEKLGFDPDLPLFLLTSGSLGNVSPAQLLPKFLKSENPSQVVMVCGSNEVLKGISEGIQKSFIGKTSTKLIIEGFTNKMPEYMKAADLVIGKSGPNTLFEAVATLTPFMAINYGGDQEKGNQELIVGYNLGLVENKIDKIWPKIKGFLENPSLLKSYNTDLEKMKDYNLRSKKILVEEIKKIIG